MGQTEDSPFWADLDLAGLSDPTSGLLVPEAPFPQFEPYIPSHVWLAKHGEESTWPKWVRPRHSMPSSTRIEWAWGITPDGKPVGKPSPSVRKALETFWKIGDATAEQAPQRILRFATRWGPLGLCSTHGRPAEHTAECGSELTAQLMDPTWAGSERIDDWLRIVTRSRAIMRVSIDLHAGRPVSRERWADVAADETYSPRIESQQFVIGVVISQWLREGRVAPVLWWGGREATKPTLAFTRATIFGVLALQLALTVASNSLASSSLNTCTNCGTPIARIRATRKGYRAFCDRPDCQRARWRLAKKDQRRGVRRWQRSTETNGGSTNG